MSCQCSAPEFCSEACLLDYLVNVLKGMERYR